MSLNLEGNFILWSHFQEERNLVDALAAEVAAFEAESDEFAATYDLDKLTLESVEIHEKTAACQASSADSAAKIRLHKQHAESLQQQAVQLTKSFDEAAEALKGGLFFSSPQHPFFSSPLCSPRRLEKQL